MGSKHKKTFKLQKNNFFTEFRQGKDSPGDYQFIDDIEEKRYYDIQLLSNEIGWNATNINYHINNFGYRGNVEPGNGISAAFGCSFTFGYGVNDNHTWPYILGIANCGQSGISNDRIVRLAISYCNTFKPKDIYVMWTFRQRREWVNENGSYFEFKNNKWVENKPGHLTLDAKEAFSQDWANPNNTHLWLQNEVWDEYNYEKNNLLLHSFCNANNITLHEANVMTYQPKDFRRARDLNHPGPDWHINIAEFYNTQ